MIAVYASRPPSPATTQHSLQGGSLLPYPGRTFTGWTAPASPGALVTLLGAFKQTARKSHRFLEGRRGFCRASRAADR